MGEPPSDPGVKTTVKVALPGVMVVIVGAPGMAAEALPTASAKAPANTANAVLILVFKAGTIEVVFAFMMNSCFLLDDGWVSQLGERGRSGLGVVGWTNALRLHLPQPRYTP